MGATVTLDEFLRWGSEEVAAKSMLVKFGGGKGNKPKKRRSVATDKGKSAVAAGGAGGSKTILGDAKDDVVDMNSVRIHDKHVRQRKYRLIANSKLMHECVALRRARSALSVPRCHCADSRRAHCRHPRSLKRHTKFDMPQLQALAREFVDESDSAGNLSKRKFQKVLAKRLPRLADDTILDQLFSVIDTNHDGNIQCAFRAAQRSAAQRFVGRATDAAPAAHLTRSTHSMYSQSKSSPAASARCATARSTRRWASSSPSTTRTATARVRPPPPLAPRV